MSDEDDLTDDDRRYGVPALEKGLDIPELLAGTAEPLIFAAIADRLAREPHRTARVLRFRGYVEQEPGAEGYRLTDRPFSLGMRQPLDTVARIADQLAASDERI